MSNLFKLTAPFDGDDIIQYQLYGIRGLTLLHSCCDVCYASLLIDKGADMLKISNADLVLIG